MTFLMGDCLEVMKSLAPRSVDCFICDLPYGQLTKGGLQTKPELREKYKRSETDIIGGCPWDVKLNLEQFWIQVKRLSKDDHTPVLMFCNTKFGNELINSNPEWFRYDLVWNKERGVSFLLANKMPMKSHEMIYVFSKKGAYYKRVDIVGEYKSTKRMEQKSIISNTYNTMSIHKRDTSNSERCALSIVDFKTKQIKGNHPTEKPMDLYKWLLERYCPKDGTVLDPTAGSFNAIFAAKELGLKGIGIEKDRNFFWKAIAKLEKSRRL